MLRILTWYWKQPGGRVNYTAQHVNIWADMVSRNLSIPHEIACVTDLPEGIDPRIKIIDPPHEFEDWRIPSWGPERPQCLRRIAMFGPEAGKIFGDRFVCMDMDCVISGSMDSLFKEDVDFRIYEGTAPGRFYNGSMMLIKAGSRTQVYNSFTLEGAKEAGKNHIGSDQAWIAHCLGDGERTWNTFDGVNFWNNKNKHIPPDNKIMFFPGGTKPWVLAESGLHPWVSEHYHRHGQGKALLLGYGEKVWDEAEEATLQYSFNGVIASPEAAALWPGEVLAEARDDLHAERLARIHGFDDYVFCGRTPKENVNVVT